MNLNATQPKSEHEQTANAYAGAMSIADFCKRYSVGRSLVYEEHRRGRIKFRKAGTRTLILTGDAERWAASLPEEAA